MGEPVKDIWLGDYIVTKELSAENAGFCKWGFVEKDGRGYFIKEFLTPKFPTDPSKMSSAALMRKCAECEKFEQRKKRLHKALRCCRNGNVVIIHDFFRDGTRYYAVSERIDATSLPIGKICRLPLDAKVVLSASLMYSMSLVHKQGIVHSDIKPNNILLKKTTGNFHTAKIIDFDSSFFEDDVPDEIECDQVYLAPEVRLKMMGQPVSITTKADIFSLGILLHQYWSGEMPTFSSEYGAVFEAVLDHSEIILSDRIPKQVQKVIRMMLAEAPEKRPSSAQVTGVFRKIVMNMDDIAQSGDAHDRFYVPGTLH